MSRNVATVIVLIDSPAARRKKATVNRKQRSRGRDSTFRPTRQRCCGWDEDAAGFGTKQRRTNECPTNQPWFRVCFALIRTVDANRLRSRFLRHKFVVAAARCRGPPRLLRIGNLTELESFRTVETAYRKRPGGIWKVSKLSAQFVCVCLQCRSFHCLLRSSVPSARQPSIVLADIRHLLHQALCWCYCW